MEKVKSGKFKAFRKKYTSELGVSVALILMFLIFSIISNTFFTVKNFNNILYQISALGIFAVGQTMVIITGGIDLSVGSIFEISGWLMCYGFVHFGAVAGISIGLAVALVCGLINGILISYVKLPEFIVTLGTMQIFHGLVYIISGAKAMSNLPTFVSTFDDAKLFGVIPSYVCILIVVFILGHLFLKYFKAGRMIYALGSNQTAAKYTGVNVEIYRLFPYLISALCAVLAAFVQSGHLNAIDPDSGSNYNLNSVAAVVIGGTALTGGKGTIIGTLIGVLITGILKNGLNLLSVSSYWQQVAIGIILIFAVAIEVIMDSRKRG